jgi:hypothetical protein
VEEVTIYNSLGIAVMSSGPKYSGKIINLDISTLSRGVYMLKLRNNKEFVVSRFIKN